MCFHKWEHHVGRKHQNKNKEEEKERQEEKIRGISVCWCMGLSQPLLMIIMNIYIHSDH